MRQITAMVVVLVVTTGLAEGANRYKVSVTRKDSNLYAIDGTSYWLKTKYCYEYAYSQDAVIVWEGAGSFSNKLVFLDSDHKKSAECDIELMLVETEPK
jgi:hypothetical protein